MKIKLIILIIILIIILGGKVFSQDIPSVSLSYKLNLSYFNTIKQYNKEIVLNVNNFNYFNRQNFNPIYPILNVLPSFGIGSFLQGNRFSGLIQVISQVSGLVVYGTAAIYEPLSHKLVITGHYLFFGGIIFGFVSAIIYEFL